MLAAIASHANERGECTASTARLAVLADRHPDTARKLIRRLKRIGLITSVNRHGRTALRTLCTDRLPVEQMELDLERLEAEQPETTLGRPRPGTRVRVGHPRPGDPGSPATHQKEPEGLKSGEERAHDHAPTPEPVSGVSLLAPRFDEVLAILSGAKPDEVLIDDRAILSALEAHPESAGYDHLKAAHRVVAWVHDPLGGPSTASAPRLLWSVLDKQAAEARAASDSAAGAPRARRPRRGDQPERERPWWDGALAAAFDGQDPVPTEATS